jgi:hypothetical protein
VHLNVCVVVQAFHLVKYGKENLADLDKLRFLKLQAVKWQMALCVLLAAALVLSRLLPWDPSSVLSQIS